MNGHWLKRGHRVKIQKSAFFTKAVAMGIIDSKFGKKRGNPNASAEPPADKAGFLESHFGNPESKQVYGAGGNDYETEEEQVKGEKISANQSLWYIGAFSVLMLLAYLFFT